MLKYEMGYTYNMFMGTRLPIKSKKHKFFYTYPIIKQPFKLSFRQSTKQLTK